MAREDRSRREGAGGGQQAYGNTLDLLLSFTVNLKLL